LIETEPAAAVGAGKDERQARRPILQIVKGLPIGRHRVWMIDALHDLPRRRGCPPVD